MKILNIDICLFCECRSFFFEFPADQACGSVYTTAVKKVSKNMNMLWHYKAEMYIYTCFIIRYMHCECDAGIPSANHVLNSYIWLKVLCLCSCCILASTLCILVFEPCCHPM